MSNLIPPHSRVTVKHEYLARVVSVSCLLLGIIFGIFATLLIPSFVFISTQLSDLERSITSEADTEAEFLTVKTALSEANGFVTELNALPEHYAVTPILEMIMNTTHNGITLLSFQFPNTETISATSTIYIRGKATSRIALATFKQALEATSLITSATIPLSDLARDSELPFAITVALDSSRLQTP